MTRPPMPQRRTWAIGGLIVAATAAVLLVGNAVLPRVPETCLGVYEDSGGNGDTFATCNLPASLIKIPNLGTHTEGLHNGCNRGINQSSTWSDCISSVRLTLLPAGVKAVFYQDVSYNGQVACVDTDGNSLTNFGAGANDVVSSLRIISGSC